MLHKPVLVEEVLQILSPRPGDVAVDATLGSGGHSQRILEGIEPSGKLIGLDQDPASIERCRRLFAGRPEVILRKANFVEIEAVLAELHISQIDVVIMDTGFSSDQLEDSSRGLSFEREGPLDMRLDPDRSLTAAALIHRLSKEALAKIFWEYGEERRSRQFAEAIIRARQKKRISTTSDLVDALSEALPGRAPAKKKQDARIHGRHFATRVFQALRIAVNDELGVLETGLRQFWKVLRPNGRMAVIDFHSLEDRIVKNSFREWSAKGEGSLLTKKPIQASREEIHLNPRARSAKLRGILKK